MSDDNRLDEARRFLAATGHASLASQINGDEGAIIRPCRPLTDLEAFAMLRCWRHCTADRPICTCTDATPECPHVIVDEDFMCRPDWDDERVIAERVASLSRPMGLHPHRRGEVCTWPDTLDVDYSRLLARRSVP